MDQLTIGWLMVSIVRLSDLWISVPVNCYGHVGTLPPFYECNDSQNALENITNLLISMDDSN